MIFCLVAAVTLSASNIDKTTASRLAASFVNGKGLKMDLLAEPVSYTTSMDGQDLTTKPLFYAFNATNNKGFVIVAAQDCNDNILGYSTSGTFAIDCMPETMRFWIEGISHELERAAELGYDAYSTNSTARAAIDPMVTSTWNQDAPYNDECPEYGGQRCPTGCLATAVAQIMYYHRWPVGPVDEIPAYRTDTKRIYRPALPSVTFNWQDMRDSYRSSDSDGAPVAQLMSYVGQSVYMDYAPEASGASDYYVPSALSDYFGYSRSSKRMSRYLYTVSQWEDIIYNELTNQRPVLYCGYTPNWEGHAFVCDGYDGEGLYHINWGWGGYGDGYFRLAVLNPFSTSGIGAASTDDGFSEGQVVVVGIQPTGNADVMQPWPLLSLNYSNNNVTAKIQTMAGGSHEVSLATISDDGTITPVISPVTRTFYTSGTSSATLSLLSLSAGDYKLYVVVRASGTEDWTRVGGISQYADVHVAASGDITVEMHPVFDVTVTDIRFPKTVISGRLTCMEIALKNNADEFDGKLYVACGPNEDMTTQCGSVSVGMMPGDEFRTSISIVPPVVDNLTVWVATDDKFNNIIGKHTFCNYDISIVNSEVEWDPAKVTITLQNNSPSAYQNQIFANIYQDGVKKALGSLTYDVDILPGGTADLECTLNFDKNKKYYITLQHIIGELNNGKKTIPNKVYVQYEASGITDHYADSENSYTHNVSGQQVGRDYKGIVICNGKKYLNK